MLRRNTLVNASFSLSRRNLLTAAALFAGGTFFSPLIRVANSAIQTQSKENSLWFKLGTLSATLLTAGQFEMSTAELFPEANAELLKEYGLDKKPFIFEIHSLFIDTGRNKVIIDPGGMNDKPDKLINELGNTGIDPAAIDTVIITHAHFDHYLACVNNNNEPAFPNAKYYLQKREWNYWLNTNDGEEYHVNQFRKTLAPIEKTFVFVDGDQQIIRGIEAMLTPGHSPGHMTVHIGKTLAYTGDVLLQPVHVTQPEWIASWNRWPQQVVASRKKFLQRVAGDNALVLGTHFPMHAMGHVIEKNGKWDWLPGV